MKNVSDIIEKIKNGGLRYDYKNQMYFIFYNEDTAQYHIVLYMNNLPGISHIYQDVNELFAAMFCNTILLDKSYE